MKKRSTQIKHNRGGIEVHKYNTMKEEQKYTNTTQQIKKCTQIRHNKGRIEVHKYTTIDEEQKYRNTTQQRMNRSIQIQHNG